MILLRWPHVRATARLLRARIRAPRLLATRPLPEVLAQLGPLRHPVPTRSLTEFTLPFVAVEYVLAKLRLVPNTCLYRSLGRYAALRGEGIAVCFVMGVRPEGSEMVGHAWLEHHGKPLSEVIDPRLVVTYAHPTGSGVPLGQGPSHQVRHERGHIPFACDTMHL